MELNNLQEKNRKYCSQFRKNIVLKISKLKLKKDFIKIYNIIYKELGNDLSINKNGIFFNINMLTDNCIEELDGIFKDVNLNTDSEVKIKYPSYNLIENENNNSNFKLSNQEKSILKKIGKIQKN